VTATFSWNLFADLAEMWSLPFMLNAFRAGTIVAVLAGLVGWFMVLRREAFAGHTLALVGFPGAAAAVWLGLSVSVGYLTACLATALVISAWPARDRSSPGHSSTGQGSPGQASAVIGTVQAVALASGLVFIGLYHGYLTGTTSLLFGSFLGITAGQVRTLLLVAVLALAGLAAIGRPLLFASVDADVARAHGIPGTLLSTLFLVLLGVSAAEVSQVTGALLVFALLVLPPATAQLLSPRPLVSLVISVGLALGTVWIALFVAYYSPYPIGFWLTSIGFGGYLAGAAAAVLRSRRAPVVRVA
jgi:zinc/manganese transport system permease protein